jgi:tRNA threonylcarbamoyl adenosine modification protein YjeE
MLQTISGGSSFSVLLENEQSTSRLVIDIANALEPGDFVTLSGDLGAGKTTFTRALIRYLADDQQLEVPSPTFTLMQTYDLPPFPLVHIDLFRLSNPGELTELGLDDLPDNTVTMLEWPDRAAGLLPRDRFEIAFTLAPHLGAEGRHAQITGHGSFAERADRIAAARHFLDGSDYANAERRRLFRDASTRTFERLLLGSASAIFMNSPPRPDGPPVRDGKPYSAIAHLAEDVKPYVAIATALRERGFSAPAILQADLDAGFLIIEDLGSELIVAGDPLAPMAERYAIAVDMLAALHRQQIPQSIPILADDEYTIPRYDIGAYLIEAELLLDWYVPRLGGRVTPESRAAFVALWREALLPALAAEPKWVLRDFHSPNLLWLAHRKDIARVGLLDFQDAQIGPAAYDVASLLQDARVNVSEELEVSLLSRYVRSRRELDHDFDPGAFTTIYAALAAQRASKILGIFSRLERRDGKPQYLRHMPRVWGYLQRSLAHPALASLNAWYKSHVPAFPSL